MANEIQLLNNISSEVDESKLRIFFTIQCSKGKEHFVDNFTVTGIIKVLLTNRVILELYIIITNYIEILLIFVYLQT